MLLRNRLFWLLAPLVTLTLATVYLLADRILLKRFDQQDATALRQEVVRLHSLMRFETGNTLDLARSYAWWSESLDYVREPAPEFIEGNLDEESVHNMGLDFMLYLDPSGKVLAERWVEHELEGAARPQNIDAAVLQQAIVLHAVRLGAVDNRGDPLHSVAQLSLIRNVPLILVSAAITDNQAKAPPLGAIVAGRFLGTEHLDTHLSLIDAKLELLPPDKTEIGWPFLIEDSDHNAPVQISPRKVEGQAQSMQLLYRNAAGEPELLFALTKPRVLYQGGKQAIDFFLYISVSVAVAALLLAYLALEFGVLRRIMRLNREVAAIGHDARTARIGDLGKDELGQLSRELNRMLERLQQSEARDRLILDSIQDAYFEIDARGTLRAANQALCDLFGYSPDQIIGRSYREILGDPDVERAKKQFAEALRGGKPIFTSSFKRRDGNLGHFETRFSIIQDMQGQFAGFRGILRDITAQMAYQNQLLDMAYRDPLTNLGNRKAFSEQLKDALELAQRQQSSLALLYLDLDRFKEVNDRFGHDIGDALLVAIADRLRGALRQPDRLYRLGGDEFTLLLPGSDGDSASGLALRLVKVLDAPFTLGGHVIDFVTPSVGIALFPTHAQDAESLIKAADSAMYQAKRQRNCAFLYHPPRLSTHPQSR